MSVYLSLLSVILLKIVQNAASGQAPPQGFRYASYDVIIPRKLSPKYGQEEPQDVSYLLPVEGNPHVVFLRQRRNFIPKVFPLFTYNTAGDLQVDNPFIKDDCFYHGFIQRKSPSRVTLSTCSGGLRGLIQMENKTYEIEPVQESSTFQHVVFRLEVEEGAPRMICGVGEKQQSHQEFITPETQNLGNKEFFGKSWWPHTRYVKVAIVIDHERYLKFHSNESFITMQVLDIIHTANSFYDPLSVHLSITGLVIWSQKNLIDITHIADDTLLSFNEWRTNHLLDILKNDVAHLFAYKDFGLTVGLAYIGTICNNYMASAIESYRTPSLFYMSVIFTHELGHVLGMQHDEPFCHCEKSECIMAPFAAETDKFSNCSFKDYFHYRNTECLFVPPDTNTTFKFESCGNKRVEKGEQCDCGSETQCKSDPCCQGNCRLRPRAVCSFGLCCTNCQYRQRGTVCREKISSCDLPEYCNGTSEHCPEDVHVQDGAVCNDGVYCYHGNCTTHDMQCKMIFGSGARVASEVCFREVNNKGDRFGNCGLKHGKYKKCDTGDSLCGRIQCKNEEIPSLEDHTTIIHTSIEYDNCFGTDYHTGMKVNDIGAVRDGTPCGDKMLCIEASCVNVSILKYDCNVTMCHNRGVCNTLKHCHCDIGWAPPDCSNIGYGGSIDSGPLPISVEAKGSVKISAITGIFCAFCLTIVSTGLVIWFKDGLRNSFGNFQGRIHATKSKDEGAPM
ncbi:disintegrin and metalloproteinase domain-containing protein 20-like [Thamnophis elegans]|uniref:disintegrin and metalloproteinase domain-containing protein 20-like n=1 Tax=Thamnophis elegans TaxID=35005 RepID=UPI0013785DD0|nr:disintegrin and metalloproteinase domain-containing protein 20-like [Thamnophis elegans]